MGGLKWGAWYGGPDMGGLKWGACYGGPGMGGLVWGAWDGRERSKPCSLNEPFACLRSVFFAVKRLDSKSTGKEIVIQDIR